MTTATSDEIRLAVPGLYPGLLPPPAEIPEMIRNLGLKAKRESYRSYDDAGNLIGCCAMGAVLMTRVNGEHVRCLSFSHVMPLSELGLPADYQDGVADGFDGNENFLTATPDYIAGHAYGVAAWQACVEAGITEDLREIDETA